MARREPPFPDPAARAVRIGADILRGNRLQLAAALLLALASTAGTLGVPLIMKDVIDSFARDGSITAPLLEMAGVALVAALASAGSGYLLARLGEFMLLRLRRRVMAHTLALPLSTVRTQGAGNLVARVTSDALLLRAVIDVGLVQLPLAVLTVVSTLIIMAVLDWVLVLVAVAAFAVAGAGIGFVIVRVKRNVVDQQEAIGGLAQRYTAHLAALATIKAYRSEERAAERLGDDAAQLTGTSLTGARLQSLIGPVMGLGQQIALVSVIIGGGARMAHGQLTTADFAAFLLYLLQLVTPVTMVATGIGRLQAGLAAKARFNDLLALSRESDEDSTAEEPLEPLPGHPAVAFQQVGFSYAGPAGVTGPSAAPVLTSLSFTAPRTGLTALVGPSGAGKSTALALIDRFATAGTGRVEVLGHDVRAWPLPELRRRVTYVDQQFTLLEGTVRENLQLGHHRPPADGELIAALDSVGLREDVEALPDGLDTVLGRENDLSGGQRQRLALARALLMDADIVLLDEPTSQLDSINELRFRHIVEELSATRAIVVVAHRLSTVRHADHVVMLSGGTLVDAATHPELMARCAAYRELVTTQALESGEDPADPSGPPAATPAGTAAS
ncbi:ABC transporter ATP-binding protein [Streptomyces sp. MK5]|uniref:ABC transporter ATP-binding protein n=1 Tax=Streptomyces sp. MK5 TaxID=3064253 RepID=UPI00274272BD|nr:ABC transporter ATP-binding protein [Streptomyces sp. MK5]